MQPPPPKHGLDPISEESIQAPANLRACPKGGYAPIKAAPTVDPCGHISGVPPPATAIPAKPPTGARSLNPLEAMQALPEMARTVQQQRLMNERNFQIMSEIVNRPVLSDSDMGRLAPTMIRAMQQVSQGAAPSSWSGATWAPAEPEHVASGSLGYFRSSATGQEPS
eukprot:859339-Pyramimonas_sp.AAC.1